MSSFGSSERATPSTTTMVFCSRTSSGRVSHVEQAGDLEQQRQQLRHRDLVGGAVVDRLADGADRLGEILDRVVRRHVARLEMHLGDAAIVAGDEAEQDFGEEAPLLRRQPAHDAEIDGDEPALADRRTDCPDACRRGRSRRAARGAGRTGSPCGRASARSRPAASSAAMVVQRDAVDPLDGQHVVGGALPVDLRHAEIRIVLACSPPSPRGRGRFQPEIHLHRHRARQRVDDLDRPQPARFGANRSRPCRPRRRNRRRGRA